MSAKGDDGGERPGSDDGNDRAADRDSERALTKKPKAQVQRNEAADLLENTNPDGPPQIAMVAAAKRYAIAATGATAGAVISIGALIAVILSESPDKWTLAIVLAMVVGGCVVGLANTGHLRTQRNIIDYLVRELERKSKEYNKHVDRQMKNRQSSAPLPPGPPEPAQTKPKKGDKKK